MDFFSDYFFSKILDSFFCEFKCNSCNTLIVKKKYLCQKKLSLRGNCAPKKRIFQVKFFQKSAQNAFFGLLFKILAGGAENVLNNIRY